MESKLIQEWRNWEELDVNMLRNGVSAYDINIRVSLVCRSWKLAYWDAYFWGKKMNVLDLSPLLDIRRSIEAPLLLKACERFGPDCLPNFCESLSMTLMKFLNLILMDGQYAFGFSLEHWRLSIKTLLFPKYLILLYQHLSYLFERIPNLENLEIVTTVSSMITSGALAKAISYWKKMKHIKVGMETDNEEFGIDRSAVGDKEEREGLCEILHQICKNCSQLESLHVTSRFLFLRGGDVTRALVTDLPQLKTLKFERAKLFAPGMNIILNNSLNNLEEIFFCDCYFMQDKNGCDWIFNSTVSFSIRFSERKQKWSFEAAESDL